MVDTRSRVWMSLLIVVFTASALGCATSSGVPKHIGPNDLPSLAGTWVGQAVLPSGRAFDTTTKLSPNGDYAVEGKGFSATGKAVVKDGNLVLTSTSTSGGIATGQRTSSASLSQGADGALTLTGYGHSDAGPFNFLITRQK